MRGRTPKVESRPEVTRRRPRGQGKAALAKALPAGDLALSEPPADMPKQVRDVWTACVTEMGANRHLRAPDLVLLRAYCEAAYLHLQASAMIHAQGLIIDGAFGPITNPMIKVQKDAATTIRQLSDVLGLNPLARIRGGLLEIAGQSMVLDIRERLVAKLAKG